MQTLCQSGTNINRLLVLPLSLRYTYEFNVLKLKVNFYFFFLFSISFPFGCLYRYLRLQHGMSAWRTRAFTWRIVT